MPDEESESHDISVVSAWTRACVDRKSQWLGVVVVRAVCAAREPLPPGSPSMCFTQSFSHCIWKEHELTHWDNSVWLSRESLWFLSWPGTRKSQILCIRRALSFLLWVQLALVYIILGEPLTDFSWAGTSVGSVPVREVLDGDRKGFGIFLDSSTG